STDIERPACLRIVPTACGQAADINTGPRPLRTHLSARRVLAFQCSEIAHRSRLASRSTLGAILPLHDVRYQSVITRPHAASQLAHRRGIVFDGRASFRSALLSKSHVSKSHVSKSLALEEPRRAR